MVGALQLARAIGHVRLSILVRRRLQVSYLLCTWTSITLQELELINALSLASLCHWTDKLNGMGQSICLVFVLVLGTAQSTIYLQTIVSQRQANVVHWRYSILLANSTETCLTMLPLVEVLFLNHQVFQTAQLFCIGPHHLFKFNF